VKKTHAQPKSEKDVSAPKMEQTTHACAKECVGVTCLENACYVGWEQVVPSDEQDICVYKERAQTVSSEDWCAPEMEHMLILGRRSVLDKHT
jgi:hypothetical protein